MHIIQQYVTNDGKIHNSLAQAESQCCTLIDNILYKVFIKTANINPLARRKISLYLTENTAILKDLAKIASELEDIRSIEKN